MAPTLEWESYFYLLSVPVSEGSGDWPAPSAIFLVGGRRRLPREIDHISRRERNSYLGLTLWCQALF